MTFVHRFNRALSVTDNPPVKGQKFVQNIEWTAQPKPKHLREYVYWCHTIYSQLSNRWGLRLMQAIQVAPARWEFWGYTPGEPPKRLEVNPELNP